MSDLPPPLPPELPPQLLPSPPLVAAAFFRTPAGKGCVILGLLLLMQVPLYMVSGLIAEREARQVEVLAGFRRGWGPEQALGGPVLSVPYSWETPTSQTDRTPVRHKGWLSVPPTRLAVAASLRPETRRRGLFHAVVYGADVELEGEIRMPGLEIKDAPGAVVDWSGARVLLGATDLRGMPADARLQWHGDSVPWEPIEGVAGCALAVLSAPAGLTPAPATGEVFAFKTRLTLRGTQAFRLVPLGPQVALRVSSPWLYPSFNGATLPLRYDLAADGFKAEWEAAGDGENAVTQQRSTQTPSCYLHPDAAWFNADAQVGVELQEAVPTYLMVSRASKYGVLFLALTYLTLFLFEMLSRVRVHAMQYGLVGLSVSLFALLLISIAERLGFGAAYAIATGAVLAQASLYTLSVVRRVRLAAVFAGVLGGLFGFFYVVLSLDAYALLGGAVALFAILSVVMVVTRRVDWAGS